MLKANHQKIKKLKKQLTKKLKSDILIIEKEKRNKKSQKEN